MEENKKENRYVDLSRKTANLTSFNINTVFLQVSEMKTDFFFLGMLTLNVFWECLTLGQMFHSIYRI